jgi:5-(carboxyamino)imidazole ribonucleotide synthase
MRIGVLGAGQLGRMLALAGYPLGLRFRFLDPAAQVPAAELAEWIQGDYHDDNALARFMAGLDAVTYEFENISLTLVHRLAGVLPVYPPPAALEVSQDRLHEKRFFQSLGLATAPFADVPHRAALELAIGHIGLPALLKTRRFGYDGKGQYLLRQPADADDAWHSLGRAQHGLLLEGLVRFDRELAQLAVRGRDGAMLFYPLVETHHAEGMLRRAVAPAPQVSAALQEQGMTLARRALETLQYVGVLAIELFQQGQQLIVNEMAPRVHNSGHWTIEGSQTSQFENHLRAVLGWPLGQVATVGPCTLVNLIGTIPDPRLVLAIPDTHLHLYGKAPRPGRKLGHITVRAATVERMEESLARLQSVLSQH